MSGLFVENQGPNWKKILYHGKSTFAVLLSIAVLVTIGWLGYSTVRNAYLDYKATDDYLEVSGEPVVYTVAKGASVNSIGSDLAEKEIIKSTKAWKSAVAGLGSEAQFQAGRFELRQHMPAEEAAKILSDPTKMIRTRVTIPEGYRMTDQWPIITKGVPAITAKQLQDAAKNKAALGLPAWATNPNSPEGFLYPETYEVDDTPTGAELMQAQVAQFTKVTTELNFDERAKTLGLTPLQALTLASIVEREASNPEDMAMVAGVFYNRLAKKMKFESDATVVYANNIKGRLTTTDKERANPSPYNTYVHVGLPPGPISNPGAEALNAVLNPTKHDYLYFVLVDPETGKTEYNTTWEGHEQSRQKFVAWCQAHPGKC
ncbi:endolytic transglycosylase MltG [Propionibacteriaceae bacterium G1746]